MGCLSCRRAIGAAAGIVTIVQLMTPSRSLCARGPAQENGVCRGWSINHGSFFPSSSLTVHS